MCQTQSTLYRTSRHSSHATVSCSSAPFCPTGTFAPTSGSPGGTPRHATDISAFSLEKASRYWGRKKVFVLAAFRTVFTHSGKTFRRGRNTSFEFAKLAIGITYQEITRAGDVRFLLNGYHMKLAQSDLISPLIASAPRRAQIVRLFRPFLEDVIGIAHCSHRGARESGSTPPRIAGVWFILPHRPTTVELRQTPWAGASAR